MPGPTGTIQPPSLSSQPRPARMKVAQPADEVKRLWGNYFESLIRGHAAG